MKIRYTPKESRGLLPPGTYVARVKSATGGYSMNGDQMIEMEVFVGPNSEMKFTEKLYNTEDAQWKITQVRHALGFSDEIGVEMDFDDADLVGCSGVVKIGLGKKVTKGKYEGKQFIEILKWLPRGTIAGGPEAEQPKDEIPMGSIPF